MARQGDAVAPREQREPVVEVGQDLLHAEDPGTDRGKLEGQWQPVQATAETDDGGTVARGEFECPGRAGRALDEQRHCLVLSKQPKRLDFVGEWQLQGRDGQYLLTGHRQWFPARGKYPHPRCRLHHRGGQPGCGVEEVLAVIQHK